MYILAEEASYWEQIYIAQFGSLVLYNLSVIIAIIAVTYIASRIAMEQLDVIEYLWIVIYGFMAVSIVNLIAFYFISSIMFEVVDLQTVVTSAFDDGFDSLKFYLMAVFIPFIPLFFSFRRIFKHYLQFGSTANYFALAAAFFTLPWIFFIF